MFFGSAMEPATKKLKGRSTSMLDFFQQDRGESSDSDIGDYGESSSDSDSRLEVSPGATASAHGECSSSNTLPVVGPYDLGTIKISLLRGRISDEDKYKVLKNLDHPEHFNFPKVLEGQQLRRFQSSWFSKYPWQGYSRSENGGYCAYCLAFPSSLKRGGKPGSLVTTPLVKFN